MVSDPQPEGFNPPTHSESGEFCFGRIHAAGRAGWGVCDACEQTKHKQEGGVGCATPQHRAMYGARALTQSARSAARN